MQIEEIKGGNSDCSERTRPLQFPEVEPNVRRALLRRFPFAVYFLAEAGTVEIIAVLHMRRDPETWRTGS